MWFDRGELEAWMATRGQVGSPLQQLVIRDGNERSCPRCTSVTLQRFEFGEVRGSRCSHCRGIWLTAADVQRARALAGDAGPGPLAIGLAGSLDHCLEAIAAIFEAL